MTDSSQSTSRTRKLRSMFRVAYGLILLSCVLLPQASAAAELDPVEIKRVLTLPTSSETSEEIRRDAWNKLDRLNLEERTLILRDLVREAPRSIDALWAAGRLIRLGAAKESATDIAEFLNRPEVPVTYRQSILRHILRLDQVAPLSIIPRQVLEDLLREDLPYDWHESRRDTAHIDQAIFAIYRLHLEGENSESDTELIKQSLSVYPKSPYAWFAVMDLRVLTPQHKAIAEGFLRDDLTEPRLQMMAAAALAPAMPEAKERAEQLVRGVIEDYGEVDLLELVRRAFINPEDAERLTAFRYQGFWIIRAVELLSEDIAKPLIEDAARVQNVDIRMLAINIAAKRWPRWLLQLEELPLTDKQRLAMFTLVGYWNPGLVEHIEELAGPDAAEVQRLRMSLEQNRIGRSDLTEDHVGIAVRDLFF